MTDAKGDRSLRPHQQANVDSYLHIVERNAKGIVISGTKAIVTGCRFRLGAARSFSCGDAAPPNRTYSDSRRWKKER
jgi:4-hydroxyphenylacetate 3-hydroxylase-like protein